VVYIKGELFKIKKKKKRVKFCTSTIMDQDYLKTKNYEADSGSLLALTNQSLHAIKEKIVNTTTFAPLVLLGNLHSLLSLHKKKKKKNKKQDAGRETD
jgi:hypothetical protein